jgi:hypothetical protein
MGAAEKGKGTTAPEVAGQSLGSAWMGIAGQPGLTQTFSEISEKSSGLLDRFSDI